MPPFPALVDVSMLNGADGFAIEGINPNFGNGVGSGGAVSPAGDINGDGIGDFIIGAERGVSRDPITNQQRFTSGDVYVVFGTNTGFPASFSPFSLTGTNGFILQGGREAQGLGFSLSSAGDVNNDGFDDLLLGTRATALGQSAEPGEAFVVFGKATAYAPVTDIYALTNAEGFRIVDPNPSVPGQLGRSVSNIGDFNGDGIDDFAVGEAKSGSPFLPSGIEHGAVHVILGSAGIGLGSGTLGTTGRTPAQFGTQTTAITYHGPLEEAGLGTHVSGAGDFNGDGLQDLIVMAPGAPFRTPSERFATVIFGDSTAPASGNFDVNLAASIPPGVPLPWFFIRNLNDPAATVANAGDMNGDGLDDIIVGGPNGNGTQGVAFVIYGTTTPTLNFDFSTLDGTNGFIIEGELGGDFLGNSVHAAGDVNNDGYDDVIVGAFGANRTPGGPVSGTYTGGAAYVVLGAPGSRPTTIDVATLDGTNGFEIEGISPFAGGIPDDALGTAVSGGMDLNGDGIDDIIVGAEDATSSPGNVNTVRAGRSYVIFGQDTGQRALIEGTNAGERVEGAGGNDELRGLGGNDTLVGGPGADLLNGGPGTDVADYGDSDAGVQIALNGQPGTGGHAEGDQLVEIENITGSVFDDVITGNGPSNTIDGAGGDDMISGAPGNDTLRGGDDDDVIRGNRGDDLLEGGAGNDTLRGDEEADVLYGGAGDDDMNGGRNNDVLYGGADDDNLVGERNVDIVFGGAGDDVLRGNRGSDTLSGEGGSDTLFGNEFSDVLYGGGDSDVLYGGSQRDSLFGGAGSDTLDGGSSGDNLFGGANADTFQFRAPGGTDRVEDFEDGTDILDFSLAGLGFGDFTIGSFGGGAGTLVQGAGFKVLLPGVDPGDISGADFV
ncbi:MAG: hypothetical protein AAF409_16430 [Pseudomonadota bacterium]